MNLIFQGMVRGLIALFALLLITACGAHSTTNEDAPKMSLLDLGAGKQSGRRLVIGIEFKMLRAVTP